MLQFAGQDGSQGVTHVCVIANDRKIIWQGSTTS